MNLKGYKFYDSQGNIEACFRLKDLVLFVYDDISRKRLDQIMKDLKDSDFDTANVIKVRRVHGKSYNI